MFRSPRKRYQFGDITLDLRLPKPAEVEREETGTLPMFGLVWDSSLALSDLLVERDVSGLSVLDVGCGLGVISLLLAKMGANVTALDIAPLAGSMLQKNAGLNGVDVEFALGSWAHEDLEKTFDLVIACDVLYEPEQARVLPAFLERHAKDEIMLVDPSRGFVEEFSTGMIALGFSEERTPLIVGDRGIAGVLMQYARKRNSSTPDP